MIMMAGRRSRLLAAAYSTLVTVAVVLAVSRGASAQVSPPTGQNIAPVYEGWEQNQDGSFNLVFGYFNRNWAEEIHLPIGPNNNIEPGGPDQGQPTYFLPRRNRFLFRIRVPKDFGSKELVWTLTSNGKTERTYGTLKPDYFMDDIVIQNNTGAGGGGGGEATTLNNKAPTLKVEGNKSRTATVGEPVRFIAVASDDGMPQRTSRLTQAQTEAAQTEVRRAQRGSRGTPNIAPGLRLTWFVYRGPGKVAFDPPQISAWEDYREGRNSPWSFGFKVPPPPPDGKWDVRATFSEPGTYVLRAWAHDGGLSATEDITVVVK
jgi:hypothetical protein